MRKQIAAANWKMNLTIDEANNLIDGNNGGTISLPASCPRKNKK
jgi:triosephosphate isomerase